MVLLKTNDLYSFKPNDLQKTPHLHNLESIGDAAPAPEHPQWIDFLRLNPSILL